MGRLLNSPLKIYLYGVAVGMIALRAGQKVVEAGKRYETRRSIDFAFEVGRAFGKVEARREINQEKEKEDGTR